MDHRTQAVSLGVCRSFQSQEIQYGGKEIDKFDKLGAQPACGNSSRQSQNQGNPHNALKKTGVPFFKAVVMSGKIYRPGDIIHRHRSIKQAACTGIVDQYSSAATKPDISCPCCRRDWTILIQLQEVAKRVRRPIKWNTE